MFEIRLDEEGMKEDEEKEKEEGSKEEEEKEGDGKQKEEEVSDNSLCFSFTPPLLLLLSLSFCPWLPEQEVDPLNQTLSFQEGEELKLRDWSEVRRGWSQRTPQTLLDALANMDVNSVYNTVVEAEQGAFTPLKRLSEEAQKFI